MTTPAAERTRGGRVRPMLGPAVVLGRGEQREGGEENDGGEHGGWILCRSGEAHAAVDDDLVADDKAGVGRQQKAGDIKRPRHMILPPEQAIEGSA